MHAYIRTLARGTCYLPYLDPDPYHARITIRTIGEFGSTEQQRNQTSLQLYRARLVWPRVGRAIAGKCMRPQLYDGARHLPVRSSFALFGKRSSRCVAGQRISEEC